MSVSVHLHIVASLSKERKTFSFITLIRESLLWQHLLLLVEKNAKFTLHLIIGPCYEKQNTWQVKTNQSLLSTSGSISCSSYSS